MNTTLRIGIASVSVALAAATTAAAVGLAPDPTRLPVGDGRVSSSPQRGSVYSCQTSFRPVGPRAATDAPWLNGDGTWDSTKKLVVQGSVAWQSTFRVTLSTSATRIAGNGLPAHRTGTFPIATSDPAYRYDPNPNSIRAQSLAFTLPANPTVASRATCLPGGPVGVLVTGAVFFNALDASGRDAVAHEVRDACGGHPEMRGTYHYHALSPCSADAGAGHSRLVGYALDGFGMYGTRGESGRALANTDLDACHGHTHTLVWRGKRARIYHYHATAEYPYTIGCFRGTPVARGRAG